jgi:hypothetical protein
MLEGAGREASADLLQRRPTAERKDDDDQLCHF